MNKFEINFALKLIDKIDNLIVGYTKVRVYCEQLRELFEEEREKNKRNWKNIPKYKKEKIIREMEKGRKKKRKGR